jgi:hypothetical protein
MRKEITIGQTVKYNYSNTEVRTGEVVDYDAAANRYRVFWHTATYASGKTYSPAKRTWIKADALQIEGSAV